MIAADGAVWALRDGLTYAPERGYVAFTVPGMADYIERAEEM